MAEVEFYRGMIKAFEVAAARGLAAVRLRRHAHRLRACEDGAGGHIAARRCARASRSDERTIGLRRRPETRPGCLGARSRARSRLAGAMPRWGVGTLGEPAPALGGDPGLVLARSRSRTSASSFDTPVAGVIDDETAGRAFPRWFVGGAPQPLSHCAERTPRDPAAADKSAVSMRAIRPSAHREISFGELGAEVERLRAGLRALGLARRPRWFVPAGHSRGRRRVAGLREARRGRGAGVHRATARTAGGATASGRSGSC